MNIQDVIMIIVFGFLAFYFFWWPDLKRTRSIKSKSKELIEFFESNSELELCVEGGGDQIIIYKLNERIDPNELNKFMDKGMEVFSKFTKGTQSAIVEKNKKE